MSKILIGVPTHKAHKYCFEEFSEALKSQSITADIMFVVNNGQESYARWIKSKGFSAVENPKPAKEPRDHVLNNRNYLRDYFLGLDYDHLLLVSSDVILPNNALEMLLYEKKDILAAPYLNIFQLGEPVVAPKMFKDAEGGALLYTYKGMFPARVEEIGAAGLGLRAALQKSAGGDQFQKDGERCERRHPILPEREKEIQDIRPYRRQVHAQGASSRP